MGSVAENLKIIRERIAAACLRSGRDPGEVHLIGVTKTVPLDRIIEGVEAGIEILGENYVQEAKEKITALRKHNITWHFIGHLQTNKAKTAVEYCDCIQTLDRESLARELHRHALQTRRKVAVLIQVNVGAETSKNGVSPENLTDLFCYASALEGLEVQGLMALPPYYEDPNLVRPHFRAMRELLDQLRRQASRPERMTHLSMGMSHDFEQAIEEGATMVRIGTALFGTRSG